MYITQERRTKRFLVLGMFAGGSLLLLVASILSFFVFTAPPPTYQNAPSSPTFHIGDDLQKVGLGKADTRGDKIFYQEDQGGYAHYIIQLNKDRVTVIDRKLWTDEQLSKTLTMEECTAFLPADALQKEEIPVNGYTVPYILRYHSDSLAHTFRNVQFGKAPDGNLDIAFSYRQKGDGPMQIIGCVTTMGQYSG